MGEEPEVTQADDLRNLGWSVAVHNDYRLNGEPHTFWLWTHPDGWWVKGEGRSDCEAIAACAELARHRTSQSESDAVRELVEALEPFVPAFERARERYIKRHGSNPQIGADNFDAMPDDWKVDTAMFTMGDFRRARAALTRYRGEG